MHTHVDQTHTHRPRFIKSSLFSRQAMIVPWTLLLTVLPYCWLQTPIFPPGWEAFSRHFTLLPVFPSDSCLAALAAALWPQYVSPLFFAGHGGLADTVGRFPGRGSCQAAGYPVRSPPSSPGSLWRPRGVTGSPRLLPRLGTVSTALQSVRLYCS